MSLLAIVGRPNVGKSTLFNRLVGMRQAIVDETAGVTRDRHYGRCEWCGTEFSVVDTGGYTSNSDDIFEEEIRKQVVLAIEEANVVLFVVTDTGCGIPEPMQEKVFDPFLKLDSFAQGVGLGLPLCKLIAQCFNGSIKWDKDYKKGTRIIFTHPIIKKEYEKN